MRFNSRFLAVYGETDRELAIAELDAIRNPPGPLDIHGDFPLKPAAKVTSGDIESANLILFGTPETNAVLKRIAPGLPSELLRGDAIFVYPNPENPARYVVVWTAKLLSAPDHGVNAGWIMPLYLLPDFVRGEGWAEWLPAGISTTSGNALTTGEEGDHEDRPETVHQGAAAASVSAASARRILGANERIRVGVIGTGGRGQLLMDLFKRRSGKSSRSATAGRGQPLVLFCFFPVPRCEVCRAPPLRVGLARSPGA